LFLRHVTTVYGPDDVLTIGSRCTPSLVVSAIEHEIVAPDVPLMVCADTYISDGGCPGSVNVHGRETPLYWLSFPPLSIVTSAGPEPVTERTVCAGGFVVAVVGATVVVVGATVVVVGGGFAVVVVVGAGVRAKS
jgi:hypothetical protein